jgi:hypothetical protein
MASRGFTSPDSLPYPNNVNDPADVPPEIRVLAEATQTALNLRIPNTRKIIAGDGLAAKLPRAIGAVQSSRPSRPAMAKIRIAPLGCQPTANTSARPSRSRSTKSSAG